MAAYKGPNERNWLDAMNKNAPTKSLQTSSSNIPELKKIIDGNRLGSGKVHDIRLTPELATALIRESRIKPEKFVNHNNPTLLRLRIDPSRTARTTYHIQFLTDSVQESLQRDARLAAEHEARRAAERADRRARRRQGATSRTNDVAGSQHGHYAAVDALPVYQHAPSYSAS